MLDIKLTSYEKRIIGTLTDKGHTLYVTGDGWIFQESCGDKHTFQSFRNFFEFCEYRESQLLLVREMQETF